MRISLCSSQFQSAFTSPILTLDHHRASPGNVLPLGSDFPVEGVNPLLGFYAAVSRLSVDGTSPHGPDGWYAELSVPLLSAHDAVQGTLNRN